MKNAIQIGGELGKKSSKYLTKSIIKILSTPAGDDVKKAAIAALSASCSPNGTVVTNCNFVGKKDIS